VRAAVDGTADTYLYWPTRVVTYWVNDKGCADVPIKDTLGAIKRSFFSWAGQSCTDIYFNFGGLHAKTETNLTVGDRGKPDLKNLLIWRETNWPPLGVTDGSITKEMAAATFLTYDVDTGEIVDADIEFNGVHFWWTATNDKTQAATDIQNVVTHEAGHLIGLGHAPELESTMYLQMPQAELKKRSLHKDDILGLCHVYPFDAETPDRKVKKVGVQGAAGCTSGGDAATPLGLLSLLILLGAITRSKRRRLNG